MRRNGALSKGLSMRLKLAALVTICVSLGCVQSTVKMPTREEACIGAGDRLLALQCRDEGRLLGGPTLRGVPFPKFCTEKLDQGIYTMQEVICLSQLKQCSLVESCLD